MGYTKLAKSKNKISVNSKSCMVELIQHNILVPSGFMRPLLELILTLSICPWDIFHTLQLTHELASGMATLIAHKSIVSSFLLLLKQLTIDCETRL